MIPDRIERETVINAPVERVWELITEAEHLGRWFGDAGAEIDLRPGGALVLRWSEPRHQPRPRRGGRAAHALRLPLGALQGPGRRGAGRGQLDARRVHAPAGGRRHAAARRRERLRLARHVRGAARQEPRRATPRAGRSRLGELRGYAREGRASDERAGGRGVRRAGRPDPLARARACSPSAARAPRRRWPASCRSAAWRWSSTSRCSTAPASWRAGARPRGPLHASAPSRSARPPAGWPASRRSGTPAWRRSSAWPRKAASIRPKRGDSHEHAPDRLPAGVGGRAREAARQGEGADPRAATRWPPSAGGCRGWRWRRTTRSTGPTARRACSTCSTAAAS